MARAQQADVDEDGPAVLHGRARRGVQSGRDFAGQRRHPGIEAQRVAGAGGGQHGRIADDHDLRMARAGVSRR